MGASVRIRRPDDMHVHLREGAMLDVVAPLTSRHFSRALVMPNTTEPIRNGADVRAYRAAINRADPRFEPLMTIKLTDATTEEDIRSAAATGAVAAKLYPVGVTTNSEDGVKSPCAEHMWPLYRVMAEVGMVLSLHGETPKAFCLDREEAFLDDLVDIVATVPRLKTVLEHVTTAKAVQLIAQLGTSHNVAATITVHHLFLTLDDVIGDKLMPHHFCKPIPKRPQDQEALIKAATSREPQVLSGHGLGASCEGQEGVRLWLCWRLHCANRDASPNNPFRGAGLPGEARSFHEPIRRGLLWPSSERGPSHTRERADARPR